MTNEKAIEELQYLRDEAWLDDEAEALDKAIESLKNQKTGHWIKREIEDTMRWKECSECHSEYPNMNGLNYCPNCGAKMEGE